MMDFWGMSVYLGSFYAKMFGWVYGISTIGGYLMPKLFFKKNSSGTI